MGPGSGRVRGSSLDLHNHGEPGERIAARIMLALVPLEVLEQLYLRSIEGCAARGAALPGSRHVGRRPGAWLPLALFPLDDLDRLLKAAANTGRSEEHTSELQLLMSISFAVFCLENKIIIYN